MKPRNESSGKRSSAIPTKRRNDQGDLPLRQQFQYSMLQNRASCPSVGGLQWRSNESSGKRSSAIPTKRRNDQGDLPLRQQFQYSMLQNRASCPSVGGLQWPYTASTFHFSISSP